MSEKSWWVIFRVMVKAALLFVLCNVVYALVNPITLLGHVSLYNTVVPGRPRLPYGENPAESYSLSLNNLHAMFASHVISRQKADDEFRVILMGDSATWGWFLQADETYTANINAQNITLANGQRVVTYNLGYPIMSIAKDVLLLDYAQRYEPDMVIWLVSLESFPPDKQTSPPIVAQNTNYQRTFLDKTIVGSRRDLADMLRLQLYGFSWAATGIDQYIPETIEGTPNDLENDTSWSVYSEPTTISYDDLAFDILDSGIKMVKDIPIIIINEPMFIANGENHSIRYNTLYPRWAYDPYRVLLAGLAEESGWLYRDWWDTITPEHFSDSPVHLAPDGSEIMAQHLIKLILETANN